MDTGSRRIYEGERIVRQAYTVRPLFDMTQGIPACIALRLPKGAKVSAMQYAQYVFANIVYPEPEDGEAEKVLVDRMVYVLGSVERPFFPPMEYIGTVISNDVLLPPPALEEDAEEEESFDFIPRNAEEFYQELVTFSLFIEPEPRSTTGFSSWRYGQ